MKKMLKISDIQAIRTAESKPKGYEIVFNDGRSVWVVKRRAIVGLLLLIRYGECTEEDLTGTNGRLAAIKAELSGRVDVSWIRDRYGDANKPFSELWTEEGFSCVSARRKNGSKVYVLDPDDHERLFDPSGKSIRKQVPDSVREVVLERQGGRCNICGAALRRSSDVPKHAFSKDRVTMEIDHRVPVDRGGDSGPDNFQALCHYCNKSKRQMCFLCERECGPECCLVSPETSTTVLATGEDVSDRMFRKRGLLKRIFRKIFPGSAERKDLHEKTPRPPPNPSPQRRLAIKTCQKFFEKFSWSWAFHGTET